MTVDDVRKCVARIREVSDDAERAHLLEERLHQDVLREIAAGPSDPWILAEEALKTLEIEFSRWCA